MPDTVTDLDLADTIRGEEHEEDQTQPEAPGFDVEPGEGEVEDAGEEEAENVE